MGPENWPALQYWGCQKPVYAVCMQESLFSDRFHNIWIKRWNRVALPCSSVSGSQDPTP